MSDQFIAEIRIFPFNFAPIGWALCNGQLLAISQNTALFSLLGTNYGGNGVTNFALPNLQGSIPVDQGQGPGLSPYEVGQTGGATAVTLTAQQNAIHSHSLAADKEAATSASPAGALYMRGHYTAATNGAVLAYTAQAPSTAMNANAIALAGGGQPHNNMMPYLTLNFCIALQGHLSASELTIMGTPFLSEIRIMSFGFPPKGWALCSGQILPINQNQALFALLGTTYGGNGITNFALPNLQGHAPLHMGGGFNLGHVAGEPSHTLTLSETPSHSHTLNAKAANADVTPPGIAPGPTFVLAEALADLGPGKTPAPVSNYSTAAANTSFAAAAVSQIGGVPHENRQPFLTLNFCIALQGIFPSQN